MLESVNLNIFAQLVGILAIVVSLLVFQLNRRSRMLIVQICSCLLWTIHFMLLGAYTGSAINFLTGVRNAAYYRLGKRRDGRVPLVFAGLFVAATIITWQGMHSMLPLIAILVGTLAFWQISPRRIRLLSLIAPPLWISYNLVVGSYAGIVADSLALVSMLVGIYRFDLKKHKKAADSIEATA